MCKICRRSTKYYRLTVVSRFLLVSLIMDAVMEDATIHQRKQTLRRMTNGVGLDDAYTATLSRIREQKGNKVRFGIEALMLISHSERPFKAEELCHALAVEVGTLDLNVHNVPTRRTLLNCTLGFVTLHFMIAEICLTYLHFQSISELSTTIDTIPSTTPFLHYASCYWGFDAWKEMTEVVKSLALRHLERDASHIPAGILLRERTVDFLSWRDPRDGKHPDLRGFTGLNCISYMGVTEIALAMVDIKRWDLNGRDSNGATRLNGLLNKAIGRQQGCF